MYIYIRIHAHKHADVRKHAHVEASCSRDPAARTATHHFLRRHCCSSCRLDEGLRSRGLVIEVAHFVSAAPDASTWASGAEQGGRKRRRGGATCCAAASQSAPRKIGQRQEEKGGGGRQTGTVQGRPMHMQRPISGCFLGRMRCVCGVRNDLYLETKTGSQHDSPTCVYSISKAQKQNKTSRKHLLAVPRGGVVAVNEIRGD